MSITVQQYFGDAGAWQEACGMYAAGLVPAAVVAQADTLGKSDIAWILGWSFAKVLRDRNLPITDVDLETIAQAKILAGDWRDFVAAFRSFQP